MFWWLQGCLAEFLKLQVRLRILHSYPPFEKISMPNLLPRSQAIGVRAPGAAPPGLHLHQQAHDPQTASALPQLQLVASAQMGRQSAHMQQEQRDSGVLLAQQLLDLQQHAEALSLSLPSPGPSPLQCLGVSP
jgi:hypothetical protein